MHIPTALEVIVDGEPAPARNPEFCRLFPAFCSGGQAGSLMDLLVADTLDARALDLSRPIATWHNIDQFERLDGHRMPSWHPERVLDGSKLGRPPDTPGRRARYFTVRDTRFLLNGIGATLRMYEDQTEHWQAERQLVSSLGVAEALLDSQLHEIDGCGFWTKACERISGDFAFYDRVIRKGSCPSLLWVAGDCSGHGVDAAMLRALLMSWLEDLVWRSVKPNGRNLAKNDDDDNPFRDAHPARAVLTYLHKRLSPLLAHKRTAALFGTRGFDGAVVYFRRKKNGRVDVFIASSNMEVFRIQNPGSSSPSINVVGEIIDIGSKGVGIPENETVHKVHDRFIAAPDERFVITSDGLNTLLGIEAGEGAEQKALQRIYVTKLSKKTKKHPDKMVESVEKHVEAFQKENGKLKDDVMLSFVDLGRALP